MMFYSLALVPLVLACGPGTGPITATPTMRFTYSPPLAWTYFSPAAGGQSLSQTAAQNRINADIEYAVLKAVESYGYSTSGISVQNAVAPDNFEIIPAATAACKTTAYLAEDTAVTKKCPATGTDKAQATPYNATSTINVSSPVALYQSQWDNVATKVWQTLTTNAGVKFYGLITVS